MPIPRLLAGDSDFTLHLPQGLITYTHSDGTKFADITGEIKRLMRASEVREGFALLHGRGISIVVQEARQFVERDLMERLSAYHAQGNNAPVFHQLHALPVQEGELILGTYQSILAISKNRNGFKPELFVRVVSGTLETLLIDTGNLELVHGRNSGDYAKRGSEMISDITEMLCETVKSNGQGAVYAGTGNTTCVLYYDTGGEGANGIVRRMDSFAPPSLPASAYAHNDLEARRNRSEIPPDERQNGRAHVIAATMLQSSLMLPNQFDGRVYLVELDGPRKGRTLHIGVSDIPYNQLCLLE